MNVAELISRGIARGQLDGLRSLRAAVLDDLKEVPAWWSELVGVEPREGAQIAAAAWATAYPDHLGELRRLLRETGFATAGWLENETYSGPLVLYFIPDGGEYGVKDGIDGQIMAGYPPVSDSAAVEHLQQSVRSFYENLHDGLNITFVGRSGSSIVRSASLDAMETVTGVGQEAITDDLPLPISADDLLVLWTDPNGSTVFVDVGKTQDERIAYDWSEGYVDWHPKDLPGCPPSVNPMQLVEDNILGILGYETELIL